MTPHDVPEPSEGAGKRRRRLARPRLPHEVEGLIEALRLGAAGDPSPLNAWMQAKYAVLLRACRAWARSERRGERVARRTLIRAFQEVRKGGEIRNERSWLAVVAASELYRIYGEDRPSGVPLKRETVDVAEVLPKDEPSARGKSPAERAEEVDLVATASHRLEQFPPPHLQIATWQYRENLPLREVRARLRAWRPVGDEECRRLVRLTHAMLRALGRGVDPRTIWPSRYDPKKNRWLTTPPPPFAGLT